ncbi:hypothetical protein GYH30_025289 [Glycine max]|nr:hypothetical protein GYH30_025289 [Glycine max]
MVGWVALRLLLEMLREAAEGGGGDGTGEVKSGDDSGCGVTRDGCSIAWGGVAVVPAGELKFGLEEEETVFV